MMIRQTMIGIMAKETTWTTKQLTEKGVFD